MAQRTRRRRADLLGCSTRPPTGADLVAEPVVLDDQLRPSFAVWSPWGSARVRLEARGAHQVGNALAALAVALRCGVDLDAATAALAQAGLSPWRMELARTPSGAIILNDAYNANPTSMAPPCKHCPTSRRPAAWPCSVPWRSWATEANSEHRAITAADRPAGHRADCLRDRCLWGQAGRRHRRGGWSAWVPCDQGTRSWSRPAGWPGWSAWRLACWSGWHQACLGSNHQRRCKSRSSPVADHVNPVPGRSGTAGNRRSWRARGRQPARPSPGRPLAARLCR